MTLSIWLFKRGDYIENNIDLLIIILYLISLHYRSGIGVISSRGLILYGG
jgi:hypothetical protein